MGKQSKNVAIVICLKGFLFILNFLCWVTGQMLLGVGIWSEIALHTYMELTPEFSGTAPHVMIGIACLILVVCTTAFFCILGDKLVAFYVYAGFLICVFVMEAGVGASVLCFRDTYPKSLWDGLTNNVIAADPESTNFYSTQMRFKCCGVSNYSDWIKLSPLKVIPISCCFDPNTCVPANYGELYQQGCYEAAMRFLESNTNLILTLVTGMAVLPILCAVFACTLACCIKKTKCDAVNE